MGRLGEQALFRHLQADVPGLDAVLRFGDDRVQQALAAHELEERALDLRDLLAEDYAQARGVLGQVLVADDLQGGDGDLGRQREAAEGGPVLAGADGEHDLVVGEDGGNGQGAA